MAEIKSLSEISKKWKERATAAGDDYRQGVSNPRRDWAQAAAAADEARKAGLAEADARDAFIKGVEKAGTAKWKNRATALGPSRYRQGVGVAEEAHRQGFAPFHSVIQGVTLPPRGPKGSPENIDRVRTIAEALHSAKVGA